MSKDGAAKRKALAISRIIEDRQVDYDEAEEIYKERFRMLGRKGGGTKGEAKVRGDSSYYSDIGKAGVKAKRGKR